MLIDKTKHTLKQMNITFTDIEIYKLIYLIFCLFSLHFISSKNKRTRLLSHYWEQNMVFKYIHGLWLLICQSRLIFCMLLIDMCSVVHEPLFCSDTSKTRNQTGWSGQISGQLGGRECHCGILNVHIVLS